MGDKCTSNRYINCYYFRVFHKMLYQPPSPQRKKEVVPKETTKLRRPTFLKRSSEPLLNVKNANTQVRLPNTNLYNIIVQYLIPVFL